MPPTAGRIYKTREEVLVHFEREKKWIGPLIVIDGNGRTITIHTLDGEKQQASNAFQMKPYYRAIYFNISAFWTNLIERPPFQIFLTEVIN